MKQQEVRATAAHAGALASKRPVSTAWTLVGAALLAHAALVLAGVIDLPLWVPVVECLVASLVGIRQLRRVTAAVDEAVSTHASPAAEPRAVPAWSSPPRFPARMVVPREDTKGPAVGP
jgi:hypothetical protein